MRLYASELLPPDNTSGTCLPCAHIASATLKLNKNIILKVEIAVKSYMEWTALLHL
jgi:hypothetical protein